jgi:tRNA pseudouridine32 synthase/23S rRNA pseudouridine746 synthase
MRTGRRHQVRRHLALAGFPVMGDPRYGENNRNTEGLKLTAWGLEFTCPLSGRPMVFQLEPTP